MQPQAPAINDEIPAYPEDINKAGASIRRHGLQDNTLYLFMDCGRKPLAFNFDVGRGMTGATDQWTLKAISEFPLEATTITSRT